MALDKNYQFANILSLFPGDTWNSFEKLKSIANQSALLFHHFQSTNEFLNPGLGIHPKRFKLVERNIDGDNDWVWSDITPPEIRFIEAEYIRDKSPDITHSSQIELLHQCKKLLSSDMGKMVSIFDLVRKAWCHLDHHPKYSKLSIQLASKIFRSCFRKLDMDNLLPFIFEVEGFASYATYLERINPVASGIYSSSWLDVGFLPLSSIRATELCVTERLYGELFNIHEQGFAPVIVNEFDSVADGNHRLTTAWLWNILKECVDDNWSTEDYAFQASLKSFVHRNESAMGSVTVFECLRQLGLIFSDSTRAQTLESKLKPIIRQHKTISQMPVLFAPEYCTNAVIKDCYDTKGELRRVPPQLYETLAQSENLVLPPRASYHFTDSVAMPWFKVVQEESQLQAINSNDFKVS